ncbi:hypothetical protein [Halorhabdus amylolytica]|uniref:hypothetical protein n=1 Tax=Halorhabdus amylolytica TaxID=2559573 RepID=UPI0010A9D25B|nr:hypothetical protein [Halorhabdus amylolytica]
MSSNPNRRPTQITYRPPTTDQPEIPERDREPRGEGDAAPSVFSPTDRVSLPEMFETEADYQDR